MKLAVGFLTYSDVTVRYLPDFLASLEKALAFLSSDQYRVYAFDNSAKDDTQNRAVVESFNQGQGAAAPRQSVRYLTQGVNLGFSRAYNILIRSAFKEGAEYFLVINPDTVLESDAIEHLIASLQVDPKLAAAAPKILRWDFAGGKIKTDIVDSLGLVLKSGLKFSDAEQGSEDRGQSASIVGPTGAAGLFRLRALETIALTPAGGEPQYFDESFFMYKEDCDLAYRLFRAGFRSATVSSALVYHDRTAAAASGLWANISRRGEKSRQIRAWSFRNQHYLFLKHWKNQNIVNRLLIIFRAILLFVFSLILEQFLLKEYISIFRFRRELTNIK